MFRGRASDTGFVGEVPPKGEYFCIPDNVNLVALTF